MTKQLLRITIDFTPATKAEEAYLARKAARRCTFSSRDPYYGDYFNPYACPGSDMGMSCVDYGICPWGDS